LRPLIYVFNIKRNCKFPFTGYTKETFFNPKQPMSDGSMITADYDDNSLPDSIIHGRDTCIENERVLCDYNFLVYYFIGKLGNVRARTYLDDMHVISILTPSDEALIDADIMLYLQRRFDKIDILREGGYKKLWTRQSLKSLMTRAKRSKKLSTKRHS
jgi:hypothetical protein